MKSPTYLSISLARRIVVGIGALVLVMMVWISARAGTIVPSVIYFGQASVGEEDLFLASVRTIVWWSCLLYLLVLTGLWASARRWVGSAGSEIGSADAALRSSYRAVLISSGLAIGLLTFIDTPRLSHSLWNDEIWTMGESVHGSWHRDLESSSPEESLTEIYWEDLGLEHAMWRYESTNHHHLLNVLAKGGLTAWQKFTGAESWEFNELALRLLPFSCAAGGLLAWALFFRRLGFPPVALIVPWLLALHPWYQQHATGMRGYPLVFLALPLTLIYFLRALRDGRWSSWLGFGCGQLAMILSWPGAVMVAAPLNLCLAIGIWRQPERRGLLKRWAVINLGCSLLLLPFIVSASLQIGPYLKNEIIHSEMGWPWLRNLASYFFTGCAWPEVPGYGERSGGHVSAVFLLGRQPVFFVLVAAALLFSAVLGIRKLFSERRSECMLLISAFAIGPVLSYLKATVASDVGDVYLYPWYFVYALPLVLGVAAIGFVEASQRARIALAGRGAPNRSLAIAIPSVLLLLASYAWVVAPRTLALRERSFDPRRESAVASRGGIELTNPANAKIITAHTPRSALIYDPFGWLIKTASNDGMPAGSAPGLTQLMRIADTRDLTLFVNIGIPDEAREKYPDIMGLIDESGFFDLHSQHFGLEPRFERAVYRYRGGLFDFDFSAPKS